MTEYNAGDSITIKGIEYQILYFHKGTGSSLLTARLRAKGGFEKDVLKSDLKADEPIKTVIEPIVQKTDVKVIASVEKPTEELPEKPVIEKKQELKKKYKKNK